MAYCFLAYAPVCTTSGIRERRTALTLCFVCIPARPESQRRLARHPRVPCVSIVRRAPPFRVPEPAQPKPVQRAPRTSDARAVLF